MPIPHISPRLGVAVIALVLALGGRHVTGWTWGDPVSLVEWQRVLRRQLVSDLRPPRTRTRQWSFLAFWAALVTVLHFGGLASGMYTRFFWWDLMTHAMSGAGVAGILMVGLRTIVPEGTSPWWVVAAVFTIGAGFEVYEFVFRPFWYSWPLSLYAHDTFLDIVANTVGSALALPFVVRSVRSGCGRRGPA